MYKRMTKIVCTIGPASNTRELISDLIKNGMNVARLNFSHGTHETHRETIKKIREVSKEMGVYVGILQDLCGPKIRMGILPADGIRLKVSEEVAIRSGEQYQDDGVLPLSYPDIHKDVHSGESILLADGMIALEVLRIEGEKVICKVLNGGVIYSKKGANMPRTNLHVSAFSEKDRADLAMGLKEHVDFVAMSFVRDALDLKEIRTMISEAEYKPRLIAKIEKPQAVENLISILDVVDGVMVARGDLGVEVPLEQVPIIQKNIISAARNAGKMVITATQMLMSMVSNPRPTRGEASDVANAILDGTDAVMLSDESANGQYPIEACATLARIACATEPHISNGLSGKYTNTGHSVSIAQGRAACWLAADMQAPVIVTYTRTGKTALDVSRFRPSCPIITISPYKETCRNLALSWGTTSVLSEVQDDSEQLSRIAKEIVLKEGLGKVGDNIVITSGVQDSSVGATAMVRLLKI